MRRLSAAVLLGAVAMIFAVAAASQAETTDLWVIYDGPGVGAIVATPTGSREVRTAGPNARAQNVPLEANGFIGDGSETNPAHPNCDKLHYHGQLFRSSDPAPNACGWGRVVRRAATSTELGLAADAFTAELELHSMINLEAGAPFDTRAASSKLVQALNTLAGLILVLERRGAQDLLALARRIHELDVDIGTALLDIRQGRGDRAAHHRTMLRGLSEAFVLKRQLIAGLVTRNLVFAPTSSDLRLTMTAPARVVRERSRFEFGRPPRTEFDPAFVTYTITVRNQGPANSPPSTIVFRVNRPLRYERQNPLLPSPITCGARRRTVAVFTCRVAALASGQQRSVRLLLSADRPGVHTARATVVGPNADPDFGNNGQTRTTRVVNPRR